MLLMLCRDLSQKTAIWLCFETSYLVKSSRVVPRFLVLHHHETTSRKAMELSSTRVVLIFFLDPFVGVFLFQLISWIRMRGLCSYIVGRQLLCQTRIIFFVGTDTRIHVRSSTEWKVQTSFSKSPVRLPFFKLRKSGTERVDFWESRFTTSTTSANNISFWPSKFKIVLLQFNLRPYCCLRFISELFNVLIFVSIFVSRICVFSNPFMERRHCVPSRPILAPSSAFRYSRSRGESYAQRPEAKVFYALRGESLRWRWNFCEVDRTCQAATKDIGHQTDSSASYEQNFK